MQRKRGWKLDGSGFRKKKTKQKTPTPNQQRQLFMRYHHSQPKRGKKKNLMGKLNDHPPPPKKKKNPIKNGGLKMLMTKRHIRTRSSDQHRLLLLTEVQTKEYRHSESMETYKLHWNWQINHLYRCACFVCHQKKKRKSFHENKWSWTTCTKAGKKTSAILFWMRGTFPVTLHST